MIHSYEKISSIYTNIDGSIHEFYIWINEHNALIQENGIFYSESNRTIRQIIYSLKGVVPLTVVSSYDDAGIPIRNLLDLDRVLDMNVLDAPVSRIQYN